MSRIHDLLHKPSGHGDDPPERISTLRALRPSNIASEDDIAGPALAHTAPDLPEFPVEQAHIDPSCRLVFYTDPRSPSAHRFRLLRMRLREQRTAGALKTLLVTSPLAHDGKTTILLNLATALSERGKLSVLVIEGDLQRSSLTESLSLRPWAGLAECLEDDSLSPLSHIRRVEPCGWSLLPAGEPRRNATELLQTPALGGILQKLTPCFDWVLIDSPPVVLVTDAMNLQQHADASLLVVRAGETQREAIEHAIALLGKKKLFGVILNGVECRNQPGYQQRYYDNAGRQDED